MTIKYHLPDRLETKRLALRPCEPKDLPMMQEYFADEDATRYLLMAPEGKTPEAIARMLDVIIASYATPEPIFALAITEQGKDEYIGSCGLSGTPQGEVEVYYALLPGYWGRGYAAEAVGRLFDYAFTEMGLDRLIVNMSPENFKSQALAERLGMELEEEAEHSPFSEGLRYAISREKWHAGRS